MRLTIDVDTTQITAEDRRILMALAGHDAGELRITRLDGPDVQKQDVAPPLPVPVPAAFAARLGEAVQQFGPRGSGTEARLPFAQQAGVRTSSTMPDDDEPAEVVDGGEELVHTRWGRPEDRAPEPSDESEQDAIIRARGGMSVPRELVEEDVEPRRIEDVTRDAILGVVDAPVRHTSP